MLYFHVLEPWVARSASLPTIPLGLSMRECGASGSASCSLACPVPQSTTSLGLPVAALLRVLSSPPSGLDECFFFISLVVGLPYSSIFCQFWLFFVFKLLLSFFWLCKEAQCVYLCLHLGQKLSTVFFIHGWQPTYVEGQLNLQAYFLLRWSVPQTLFKGQLCVAYVLLVLFLWRENPNIAGTIITVL